MHPFLLAVALLATPEFPGAIQRDLGLASAPRCTVCHTTDSGGAGTVVRPFGVYLLSRGLRAFDEGSLRDALSAAAGEHHSSNPSGVSDIQALEAGEDPNAPGSEDGPVPAFGCSSFGSPDSLALLAFAAWIRRRRRRESIR